MNKSSKGKKKKEKSTYFSKEEEDELAKLFTSKKPNDTGPW